MENISDSFSKVYYIGHRSTMLTQMEACIELMLDSKQKISANYVKIIQITISLRP